MSGPNPLVALVSMVRARRTRPPRPDGTAEMDHGAFSRVLEAVAASGLAGVDATGVDSYLETMAAFDPDGSSRASALAYWLNLYNAGALALAAAALADDVPSVLRVPGGFTKPFVTVAGEALSLDDVEHGKVRRFGDPRIHAALVCGSLSCPTLRPEPYRSDSIDQQLEDQMVRFVTSGGVMVDQGSSTLRLSRILRWYGRDFTHPEKMPTLLPARPRNVVRSLGRWLDPDVVVWIEQERPRIGFHEYDWGLGCAVTPSES